MKNPRNLIVIVIIAIALAAAIVILGGVPWGQLAWLQHGSSPLAPSATPAVTSSTTSSPSATSTADLFAKKVFTPDPPQGSVTYQIAQAATVLPGFVQATIDPADVSVGQIQHFTVITNDSNPITSVVATITTDHKTITVPLASQGAPATSMINPRSFFVDGNGTLALIDSSNVAEAAKVIAAEGGVSTVQGANIANAADTNDLEFTGQWTVEDTHTAKYQTVFTAKDSAGNTNSITLQWTDPCPFAVGTGYVTGNVQFSNASSSCYIPSPTTTRFPPFQVSSVDGPEHGNLTLSSGTLTIDSNATLVINSGYYIYLSGGSIALTNGTSQILLGQDMCGTNNDGNGYIEQLSWVATTTANCTGSLVPRANLSPLLGFGNCDDADVRVFPGQTNFETASEAGSNTYSDPGWPWDFSCNGSITYEYTTSTQFSNDSSCDTSCGIDDPNYCNATSLATSTLGTTPTCGSSFPGSEVCMAGEAESDYIACVANLTCQEDSITNESGCYNGEGAQWPACAQVSYYQQQGCN
jgi:hypothetical protein